MNPPRRLIPKHHCVFPWLAALALAVWITCGPAAPASAESAHHAVNFSVLYPISTNKDPGITTNFQLAILEGRVGSIRGLAVNGGVSLIENELHGLQFTGFYSEVDGTSKALQFTGGINYDRANFAGVQFAGAGNLVRAAVGGVQLAGLFNSAGDTLRGVQLAGAYNFVEGNASFLQASLIANTSGGNYSGVQFAFGYNLVERDLQGLQVGGMNMAFDMHGAQVGLFNIARDAKGVQIGVINRTRDQLGLPIGMVQVEDDGSVEGIVYWNNLTGVNAGVRTVVRDRFYSMLTAGAPDEYSGDSPQTLSLTWNYGYQLFKRERNHLGLDLGFVHYIPWDTDVASENRKLHFAFQARGLVDRQLNRHIAIYAGGGMAWIYPEYSLAQTPAAEGLWFGGLALR
jgi:hypothetical protein